ncbi:hypothetical protein K438DRAFT_1977817 [Mycena galopus ATCC 62051]|nr:hypothetical protein K438DRAFT_1977817 [Mycena galopus ATCC 62051]
MVSTTSNKYVIIDRARPKAEPSEYDECILRSIITYAGESEHHLTFVDRNGTLYVRIQPLPTYHYLHPEFRDAHKEAMALAIAEHNLSRQTAAQPIQSITTWATEEPLRERHGFRDTSPHLFYGATFHDRLASRDPEEDRPDADPGF